MLIIISNMKSKIFEMIFKLKNHHPSRQPWDSKWQPWDSKYLWNSKPWDSKH